MEMADISVKNKNEGYQYQKKSRCNLCLHINALLIVFIIMVVFGLTIVSWYSYQKIIEQKEKIQQLDRELRTILELIPFMREKIEDLATEVGLIRQMGETNSNLKNLNVESKLEAQVQEIQQLDVELQNMYNWTRTRFEHMQDRIDHLATEDDLIRQRGETNLNLTNLNRVSQLEAQEKIQRLDAELQNISNWSRTRLELIPIMQETIDRLATEDNLTRQMAETNSNLTNLNRESQLETQEKIQRLDAELQNISNWSRTRLELIPTMQETIDRLATEDNLTRQIGEANSHLTNLNHEILMITQEKIQQLDVELQNISNWSRTRLELIPTMQETIDRLATEDNLTRQIGEANSHLTNLNHEILMITHEHIQQLDVELQNISHWSSTKLDLIDNTHEKKIQQLDAELQNISTWSRTNFELIPTMQEKIAHLVTEDELIRQMGKTNLDLIKLNRDSQSEARGKIEQLDAELRNISTWSKTRLELIPTIQEKIVHLGTEDKLIRQMEETNLNLTKLNRESQLEAQKNIQKIIDQQNLHFFLIIVSEQLKIKLRNSEFNRLYCLEVVNETIVTARPCQKGISSQFWFWTKTGEIRYGKKCLGYDETNLTLHLCNNNRRSQLWKYGYGSEESSIKHGYYSKKCLSVSDSKQELLMETCDDNIERQRWDFVIYWAY